MSANGQTSNAASAATPTLTVGSLCDIIDTKDGSISAGLILSVRIGSKSTSSPPSQLSSSDDSVQYYVHKEGQDKRLDGWIDHANIRPRSFPSSMPSVTPSVTNGSSHVANRNSPSTFLSSKALGKRRRVEDQLESHSDDISTPTGSRHASPSPIDNHTTNSNSSNRPKNATSHRRNSSDTPDVRNIDKVYYGPYEIKTWYHSPYPLDDDSKESHSDATRGTPTFSRKMSTSLTATASPLARNVPRTRPSQSLSESDGKQHPLATITSNGPDSTNAIKEAGTTASTIRNDPQSRSQPNNDSDHLIRALWICEGCFKYMNTYSCYAQHKKQCTYTHPPGRKVYQRGAHIIWEVDGAQAKLYCQNLSLFGKLFIDHKTIYFDVEPFLFYVLTDAISSFDHVLGFFSKEKVSYDDYNLACIITFPPYQRKSFGTLMIEFSYYLSGTTDVLGTPERPLSDLGLKGYLSFWSSVVLRTLAIAFDNRDVPFEPAGSTAATTTAGSSHAASSILKRKEARRKLLMLETRCKLLGLPPSAIAQQGLTALQDAGMAEEELAEEHKRRRRSFKGWAGSTPARSLTVKLRRKQPEHEQQQQQSEPPKPLSSCTTDSAVAVDPSDATLLSNTKTSDLPSNSTGVGDIDGKDDDKATTAGIIKGGKVLRRSSSRRISMPSIPTPLTNGHSSRQTSSLSTTNPSKTATATAPLETHPALCLGSIDSSFSIVTTLDLLSQTTKIRPDDIAFALSECGLLTRTIEPAAMSTFPSSIQSLLDLPCSSSVVSPLTTSNPVEAKVSDKRNADSSSDPIVLLTKDTITRAVQQYRIKPPVLDEAYILI